MPVFSQVMGTVKTQLCPSGPNIWDVYSTPCTYILVSEAFVELLEAEQARSTWELHPRKKPPSNEMEDGKGGLWPSGLM